MRRTDAGRAAFLAAALASALAACGTDDAQTASAAASASAPAGEVTGDLTVFAASSLTESFTTLAESFEVTYPDTSVTFSFGSSATLATQITSGAPADVFAAASPATMGTVRAAGDAAAEPKVFVRNRLEIVVPADNPGGVTGLADFARDDLTIGLCASEAPCGSASDTLFAAVGLTPAPDTREKDVKTVLSKVELGEVDAALVYHTDVLAAGERVRSISFAEADRAVNDYLIVALRDSDDAATAAAWIAHVVSAEGRRVLADAGFEIA